ncbi:MAG TPA: hypothetical protein VLT82_23940 [Myxococcaceae bacterium]|nr:hypothetical protein [Myxococcaceae bacterium]
MGTDEAASCFQNVDLDLTFEGDISSLILGFGSALTELHRREGFACFELRDIQPRRPDEAIAEYGRLVRALPPQARAVWNACRRRTMNVGVSAPSGYSIDFAVSRESVALLHELGADLVFTVYRRDE